MKRQLKTATAILIYRLDIGNGNLPFSCRRGELMERSDSLATEHSLKWNFHSFEISNYHCICRELRGELSSIVGTAVTVSK